MGRMLRMLELEGSGVSPVTSSDKERPAFSRLSLVVGHGGSAGSTAELNLLTRR